MVWEFGMQHQGGKTPWAKLQSEMAERGFSRTKSALTQLFKALLKEKGMTENYRNTKAKLVKERRFKDGVVRAATHQKQNREMSRARSKRSREKTKLLPGASEKKRAKDQRNRPTANKRDRQRRKEDPAYRLLRNARCRLWDYLSNANIKKPEKTLALIGCTRSQYLKSMQSRLDGRVLSECQADHIFPFGFYDLNTQLERVSNFTNMQPLTPDENGFKSTKLPTKAMAARVDPACWPDGVTMDMLPDVYPGWATPLRMHA